MITSSEDLKGVANDNTTIVTANECSEKPQDFLSNRIIALMPRKTVVKDITIEAIRPTILIRNFIRKRTTRLVLLLVLIIIEYIMQGIQT